MKTHDVEEQLGITKQALIYYEKEGLINPIRDKNNYRQYTQNDIEILQVILLLRSFEISIDEIKLVFSEKLSIRSCLNTKQNYLENEKNKKAICTTSSHNMTSERQFRNPVEYGAPKPKTTTFTVTGAASLMLTNAKTDIKVTSATIGKVIDMGVDNVFDMGAVMSPSAAYTLNEHLKQTKTKVSDYDLILTGDLGVYGKDIFKEICEKEYNIKLDKNYDDTATMIYDYKENIYAGGSGPACMPLVVYSSIIPQMKQRIIKKVLLIATGALMSPTTCNQKFSIPSVSHAVCLEVI